MAANNGNAHTRATRALDRILNRPKPALLGWQKSDTEIVVSAPGGMGRVYITWPEAGTRDIAVNRRGVPLAGRLPILVVPGAPNVIVDIDTSDMAAVTAVFNNQYGVPPHPHALSGLSDVLLTALADGEILAWDAGAGKWVNVTEAGDVAASINAASEKTTLADDDRVAGTDSEATLALTWWKWSTIKSQLVATFLTFTNKIAIAATATTGAALRVVRDLAAASTNAPVVEIHQDNAGDDQAALDVTQDGTGDVVIFKDGATTVLRIVDGGRLDVAQIIRALTSSGLRLEDDGGNLGMYVQDATGYVGYGSQTNPAFHIDILANGAGSRGIKVRNENSHARGWFDSVNGDAYFLFSANGATFWAFGNSQAGSNSFRIAPAANLGVSDIFVLDRTTGNLGLGGVTSPQGILSIRAGTSSNDAAVGGVLYKETTQRANSGTGETDLGSYAVPANTLAVNNQHVEVIFRGTVANNGNTKILKLYFGTDNWTLLSTSGANFRWIVRAEIYRTGAATQKVFIHLNRSDVAGDSMTYATATATLSGPVTLKLTGQGGASNDVLEELMAVQWGDANT